MTDFSAWPADVAARTQAFLEQRRAEIEALPAGDPAGADAVLAALEDGLAAATSAVGDVSAAGADLYRIEARSADGAVVRSHGPFPVGARELSDAYHAEECAATAHNRGLCGHDRAWRWVYRVPASATCTQPTPCQPQQTCAGSGLTAQQARWAAQHDWYRGQAGAPHTGLTVYAAEGDDAPTGFRDFAALRAWAGY